ncbi:hypothetical protein [Amycolatopsis sp. NPDC051061]|uniref:hypothetical protein n=1 Tax=Amycolatopsis sp. NPDC051061 TaxID=3155042 RepID=UPI003421B0E2
MTNAISESNGPKRLEAPAFRDPAGSAPGRAAEPPSAEPPSAAVARTLRYDLADFTGRKPELDSLLSRLDEPEGRGPRIIAIDGMGGVGKTSLAVRAAPLADRYPDGRLYLNLRGYTAGGQPLSPRTATEALLGMLGVEADQLLDDAEARTMLWRTTTAESRLVLLLEQRFRRRSGLAAAAAQPRCARADHQPSAADRPGRRALAVARHDDQRGRRRNGRQSAGQPTQGGRGGGRTRRTMRHLPLAMRIALSRLGNRPRWPIRYLVDRMSYESRRLDELKSGERGVDLTLRISYENPHHR